MTAKKLSLQGQIACVRREIGKRHEVYPHLVGARKMRQGTADYEIEAMEAVLGTLLWIERNHAVVTQAVSTKQISDDASCKARQERVA